MNLIPTVEYHQMLAQLPIVCVDVLIVHKGKCLLLLRDNEPAKNTYWFPGGRIYKNESIENAAIRKAKEETNLDCTFEKVLSTEESIFEQVGTMITDVHTINICCLMKVKDISNLISDKLHADVKWVDDIDPGFHTAVKNPLVALGLKIKLN